AGKVSCSSTVCRPRDGRTIRMSVVNAHSLYEAEVSHVPRVNVKGLQAAGRVREPAPKRVCMVAYSLFDNDNRVRRYAQSLARRGDHVQIVSLRKENAPS